MNNNEILRNELTRDEGLRLKAYKDSVGLWTIGVGHLIGENPDRPGEPRMWYITREEAMAFLEMDIEEARLRALEVLDSLLLDQPVRWRVMVNMAFNLGSRLKQFKKFLASVNAGNWEQASVEMMQSKWATQVGQRAVRLRDMMREGDMYDLGV